MSGLYSSPLRVYLLLGAFALAGVFAGLRLPVSLYPNSSKPKVTVEINYGGLTAEEFRDSYGDLLERQLKAISSNDVEVEDIEANYQSHSVHYDVKFRWQVPPKDAQRETQNVISAFSSRLPSEIRDNINVWQNRRDSGFMAISFYSEKRSLSDVYDLLEPALMPLVSAVSDADNPNLWNPNQKQVRIELNPRSISALQIFPRDVENALNRALIGHSAGALPTAGQPMVVQLPRQINKVSDVSQVIVSGAAGQLVHLGDIARIDYVADTMNSMSMKTSGTPSVILFSRPRPGGNVKKMAEDIKAAVDQISPTLPDDIKHMVIVDPSTFINNAVQNVAHEVIIGALLAVLVLFFFIGSLRNTITAAIEIPLSMVLAFILMRLSGMNLNLISLGGLALSAGMNVDASVVVMENIFRHFEKERGPLTYAQRLQILLTAVSEVRFAVIASTIASLVVFLPLAFTSSLTYAILGDLAKTVVFSHGFSAIVALVLVPTVRLQLMSLGQEKPHRPPLEKPLKWLENGYAKILGALIAKPIWKWGIYSGLIIILGSLTMFVLPRLPKEIIGMPDTDWIFLGIDTQGNSVIRQADSQIEEIEARLRKKFGNRIQYTFTQIWSPNGGMILAHLANKKDMETVWRESEKEFVNTPDTKFTVNPWNPAELPIPHPPQFQLGIIGSNNVERQTVAELIYFALRQSKAFPQNWTEPGLAHRKALTFSLDPVQWGQLVKQGARFSPSDLADLMRTATDGRTVAQMSIDGRITDVILSFRRGEISSPDDVGSFPIAVGDRIVPLRALAKTQLNELPPDTFRLNGRSQIEIKAKQNRGDEAKGTEAVKQAREVVQDWIKKNPHPNTGIIFEDPEKDLNEALAQLAWAVALSVLLIFITMVIQFGDFISALLVLVAVPLGFVGVLVSLFVFQSNLSLNSVLGVILLNGLSVANSIILVDFLKTLVKNGMSPREAAVEAARKRLRPILITSLTTVLGMLPIALGFGEGGKVLQPLGIAVAGGLWVSMGLTLFIVPALQVSYLEWRARSGRYKPSLHVSSPLAVETSA